jgi:predicted DNA-binding protein (MmcQ/YjbR family)
MHIEAIRDYCLSLPATTEDFPFDERTLVFRVGGKIYLLIDVEEAWEFNVKCDPELAIQLREQYPDAIRAGYHMNKKHWNTVTVTGLDDRLLREQITQSYALVRASLPKKVNDHL